MKINFKAEAKISYQTKMSYSVNSLCKKSIEDNIDNLQKASRHFHSILEFFGSFFFSHPSKYWTVTSFLFFYHNSSR